MKSHNIIIVFSLIICSVGCRNSHKIQTLPTSKEIDYMALNDPETYHEGLFDNPYYDSISMITGIAPGSPYWYDPSWEVRYSEAMDTLRYYPREQEDTHFTIPSSVRVIQERAFQCNHHLTEITIPEGVKEIGLGAFLSSQELRSVIILGPIQEIPWRAFDSCSKLSTVVLPSSVSHIDGYAFADCERLSCISINNPEPPKLEFSETIEDGKKESVWPFSGVDTQRCVVRVPSSSIKQYLEAPGWSQFKQIKGEL